MPAEAGCPRLPEQFGNLHKARTSPIRARGLRGGVALPRDAAEVCRLGSVRSALGRRPSAPTAPFPEIAKPEPQAYVRGGMPSSWGEMAAVTELVVSMSIR